MDKVKHFKHNCDKNTLYACENLCESRKHVSITSGMTTYLVTTAEKIGRKKTDPTAARDAPPTSLSTSLCKTIQK